MTKTPIPDTDSASTEAHASDSSTPNETNDHPLGWNARAPLAAAALLASTGICLGWPAGTDGLVLATATLIVAGAIAQRSIKNVQTRRLLDPLNGTIVWSALSLPFLVLGLSKLTPFLFMFWLLLSTLMLTLVIIWSLIAHRLQLLWAIAMVGLLIGSAVALSSHQLSFRKLQVRLAESHLKNSGPYRVSEEGVEGWIWFGGIPDGGMGVAYDLTDQLADDDFASETWFSITGDPGRCELLYDHWYWCG